MYVLFLVRPLDLSVTESMSSFSLVVNVLLSFCSKKVSRFFSSAFLSLASSSLYTVGEDLWECEEELDSSSCSCSLSLFRNKFLTQLCNFPRAFPALLFLLLTDGQESEKRFSSSNDSRSSLILQSGAAWRERRAELLCIFCCVCVCFCCNLDFVCFCHFLRWVRRCVVLVLPYVRAYACVCGV